MQHAISNIRSCGKGTHQQPCLCAKQWIDFSVRTLNHLLEFPVIFKNRMFNIRFSTKQDFAFYGLHAEPVILILVEC